jgi:hypothetical protein
MKTWYFKLPGEFYSMKVEEPCMTEVQARKWVREWLGVKTLPKGTEFYL